MNANNPYSVPQGNYEPTSTTGPKRISIGPFEALSRGYQLLGDQYWSFFGVCLVGILIAVLVPMNILLGPILVGFYFCLIEREQGGQINFNTLFRGFERFLDSFIVTILMLVINLVLLLPLMIVFLAITFASMNQRNEPSVGLFFSGLFVYIVLVLLVSIVSYLPFIFCFQLIADKKMAALDAIKLSARSTWFNLGPILAFTLVGAIISFVLAMMCYLPVLFFMPIWFSAGFVMYRQAFPETIVEARLN